MSLWLFESVSELSYLRIKVRAPLELRLERATGSE